MKRLGDIWLLALCGAIALAGCGSSTAIHTTGSGGSSGSSSGGSSGSGSGGSSGTVSTMDVELTATDTGWVGDPGDGTNTNSLGVHGSWYPYGDQYGPLCGDPPDPKSSGMKCNDSHFGAHDASTECSVITMPDPTMMSFPNTGGKMCTTGTVPKIANIVNSAVGTVGKPDYSDVWGAGIGLDLAADMGSTACDTKGVFPAKDKKVIGIKFDIDTVPTVGLRVEFPIPATDGTTNGSDYWGGTGTAYPSSPVVQGTNTIYFDPASLGMPATVKGVTPPGSAPLVTFDPNQMESIQFHVPAGTAASYSFCISNLKMMVQQ